jgi:ABC-type Mn2+/Zn2+ transport system ATPase subunit
MDRFYRTLIGSGCQLKETRLRQEIGELPGAGERGSINGPLSLASLKDVNLGYGTAPVLEGVNLAIYPGELVGLAGPNGSGKTTLFRTILGLLPPLAGTLLRNCPLANFGYVPQSTALDPQFPLSAAEIVEMGAYGRVRPYQLLPSDEKARASQVLTQVGMGHVKRKSFFALSGGQKQRVLIARALMVLPKIMILDEPLSGVDEATRHSITDLLIELTRKNGLAVFFSSHDLEMVQRVADKIVRVDKGKVWVEQREDCRL